MIVTLTYNVPNINLIAKRRKESCVIAVENFREKTDDFDMLSSNMFWGSQCNNFFN